MAMYRLVFPLICLSVSAFAGEGSSVSVFNNRAAGVQAETIYQINGMPCGTNGAEGFLWCMRSVQMLPSQQQRELFAFVKGFSAELKKWNSGSKKAEPGREEPSAARRGRWSSLLFSNQSAVILEKHLKEPDLRIFAGSGGGIPETHSALYLRLPEHFSIEQLRAWVQERGSEWDGPELSELLQTTPEKILKPGTVRPRAAERIVQQTWGPGAITIRRLNEDDVGYAEALNETLRLEARIATDKAAHAAKVRKACESVAAPAGEVERVALRSSADSLSENESTASSRSRKCFEELGYDGEASFVEPQLLSVSTQICKGALQNGRREGVWNCHAAINHCSGPMLVESKDYRGGKMRTHTLFSTSLCVSKKSSEEQRGGNQERSISYWPNGNRQRVTQKTYLPDVTLMQSIVYCSSGAIKETFEFRNQDLVSRSRFFSDGGPDRQDCGDPVSAVPGGTPIESAGGDAR